MLIVGMVAARSGRGEEPVMADYLVLIYEDESARDKADSPMLGQVLEEHQTFGKRNASATRGGSALQPTSTATLLRRDPSGSLTITDGPFAKDQGGPRRLHLIDATDLDEAIALAKQVPASFGGVEVRPVRSID